MKSNTHKIKTIAVLWFRLYLHVKLEKQHNICLTELKRCSALCRTLSRRRERERERCARAERSRRREREREREVCARWTEQTQRERERERGVCALNGADAERERERERCVCALNGADAEREREREVCVRALREQDLALARQSQWFSETRFGRFFEGKRSLKGSAMLLSCQHCASPFLQLRVGPRVKPEIRAALIAR